MLCEKEIEIGRYLCRAYYKGELRPSAAYVAQKAGGQGPELARCVGGAGLAQCAGCVEGVVLSAQPSLRDTWAALLIGDLRWLNWNAKARVMGPPVGELLGSDESCAGCEEKEKEKEERLEVCCEKEKEGVRSIDGSGALRVAEWELYRRVGARFRALFE